MDPKSIQTTPKPGQMVVVRNRPAIIRDVTASSASTASVLHSVEVEYLDGWAHPESEELIWEIESGARIIASLTIPKIDTLPATPDDPEKLKAFLDAFRWSAVNSLEAGAESAESEVKLVAPWHSAVQVEDYQLYPILKALLMPRVTLLLADDVGLGKTIEAGLIVSELFSRRRIRRVLVVCPASLQRQWQEELQEKFYLDFVIVDREETFRMQRTLGVDANAWSTYPRIITSMDYLRQPDTLNNMLAATKGLSSDGEAILPWQLLIVDEAHNLFPSRFGDDSDRYLMLKQISPYFEHRLFLTATPHNGYTVSFTGLLELLDPVRFKQTALMDANDHAQVELTMVRRLKSDFARLGQPDRFARREVKGLSVAIKGHEAELFEALRQYRKAALDLLSQTGGRERHIAEFLLTLLSKRLLSSSYAFACTWWQHVAGFEAGHSEEGTVDHAIKRAEVPVNDDEEKDVRETDVAREGGGWLARYSGQLREEVDSVSRTLEALGWTRKSVESGLPASASLPPDSRWDILSNWIDKNLKQNGRLRKDERLIVFTEYKHTLDYLMHRFRKQGIDKPELEAIFGGRASSKQEGRASTISANQREIIKEAFNDPDSPLRILVATDTASEGINLQTSCRYIFHQEIPWNPMRLEQRNGRVDRHGQARNVSVFHFTSDDEADLKFMAHVVKKVEQAREDLGSVGQVLDQTILEHFTRKPVDEATIDTRVEMARKDEVDSADLEGCDHGTADNYAHSLQRLRATEMNLGLSSTALAQLLSQAMAIERGTLAGTEEQGVFRIQTVPPTWKKLIKETLEIKKGAQQSSLPKLVFDPAYFESTENGRHVYRKRSDTVLIRLGHPVMRRALWTLRRQLWESTDLSRWTITEAALPGGIEQLLVLHLMLEVSNALRENVHQEVIIQPFQVSGDHLTGIVPELWQQVSHLERRALTHAGLSARLPGALDRWTNHELQIRDFITNRRKQLERDFAGRMSGRLKEETSREKARFTVRLREIQNEPRWLEKQRAELERQRQRLQQPALFDEIQSLREQQVRDLEWEVMHSHIEQMKELLVRERTRMLDVVLPKRFSLASINLQPLAVEYIVRDEGRRN